MRRKILWAALAVAAVTLLAGVLAGAAIQQELVRRSEAELLRQADATAALVQRSIRDALPTAERTDATPIGRTLEIARSVGGHDYVEARVVDVPLGRPNLPAIPTTPLLDSLGEDPELNTVTETEVGGEPVLAYVRAVPVSARSGATVLIAIGRTEPLLATNILTRPLLISLGIGGILAVALANWVAGQVSRRLQRLETAAGAIAGGDFSVRAPDDGDDDVARLGRAFNEMAAELDEGRERERDFLMSVGHDLRTPLTTLQGYAEAIDSGAVEREDLERVGDVLLRQTDRLGRLIEDLMMLARLEARQFTLRPEAVDLTAHVGGLIEAQRLRAETMNVGLAANLDPVGSVDVDPDRVGQILGNLIDNALRYTPESGTVTVSLDNDNEWVVLRVADTGIGIDHVDLPHVFDRLYVAQRYEPVRPEGSGLGLSIVKELVSSLGGHIEVTSNRGVGTTVMIRLPRRPDGLLVDGHRTKPRAR